MTPDEKLLAALQVDPKYSALDVRAEIRKCQLWGCGGRTPTKRKIVNWLNKAAKKKGLATRPEAGDTP